MQQNNYSEKILDFIWAQKLFSEPLITHNGEYIYIRNTGYKNFFEGPDYKDAEIIVNGEQHKSDIELEIKSSGWFTHGHSENVNFEKTDMLIYFENDLTKEYFVKNKKRIKFPKYCVCITDLLLSTIEELSQDFFDSSNIKVYCSGCAIKLGNQFYSAIIEFGKKNIERKINLEKAKISEFGFIHALIIQAAAGLGYSANKENFINLAKKLNINLLKSDTANMSRSRRLEFITLYILKIAGADISSLKSTEKDLTVKHFQYSDYNWRILRNRPKSRFYYKLFNLSAFVSNIIIKQEDAIASEFQRLFFSSDELVILTQSVFKYSNKIYIGCEHSKIILMNCILPDLAAYFLIQNDLKTVTKILDLINKFPGCMINHKITKLEKLFGAEKQKINNSALMQFGLLYIYDNFCFKYLQI